MFKRFFGFILSAAMIFALALPAAAADTSGNIDAGLILPEGTVILPSEPLETVFFVDGKRAELGEVEYSGWRTMVSAEKLSEVIGGELVRDGDAVGITYNDITVLFTEGSYDVTVQIGGYPMTFDTDVASYMKNGELFVPLRFACEGVGLEVVSVYNIVTITDVEAAISALDERFTIFNGILEKNRKVDSGSAQGAKGTTDLQGTLTLYNGESVEFDFSLLGDILTDGVNVEAEFTYDFADFMSLIEHNLSADADEELVRSMLSSAVTVKLNGETGEIYMKGQLADLMLSNMGYEKGAWLKGYNAPVTSVQPATSTEPVTMGQLLYTLSGYGMFTFNPDMTLPFEDSTMERTAGGYSMVYDENGITANIAIMMVGDNVTGVRGTMDIAYGTSENSIELYVTGNNINIEVTASEKGTEYFTLSFKTNAQPYDEKVDASIPEGDTVVEIQ